MSGVLYLLPAPLQAYDKENAADALLWQQIPAKALQLFRTLPVLIAESEKTALRLLSRLRSSEEMASLELKLLNEHSQHDDIMAACAHLMAGIDCGFFSDAGEPCIADPGAALVAAAHERNIRVVPIAGPSSILLGLMASGLDAQRFCFLGYLPQEKNSRVQALRQIASQFSKDKITRIFIETPYRNEALWQDCLKTLPKEVNLGIGQNICGIDEYIDCKTVHEWESLPFVPVKSPAIFMFGEKASICPSNTR